MKQRGGENAVMQRKKKAKNPDRFKRWSWKPPPWTLDVLKRLRDASEQRGKRRRSQRRVSPNKGTGGRTPHRPGYRDRERRPRRSRDVLKVNPGTPSADRDCSLGQMERGREEDKKRKETGGKRREEVGQLCPVLKRTGPKISTIKALK